MTHVYTPKGIQRIHAGVKCIETVSWPTRPACA